MDVGKLEFVSLTGERHVLRVPTQRAVEPMHPDGIGKIVAIRKVPEPIIDPTHRNWVV
jgi:hypothetical protein